MKKQELINNYGFVEHSSMGETFLAWEYSKRHSPSYIESIRLEIHQDENNEWRLKHADYSNIDPVKTDTLDDILNTVRKYPALITIRDYADLLLNEMLSDYIGRGYKQMLTINPPAEEVNFTAEDVVKYMANLGYVIHEMYRPGAPSCMLGTGGIEHIDPTYFESHIAIILEVLYNTGGRHNINALLQFPKEHLDRSNEIAKLMQDRGLIQTVQVNHLGYTAEISPQGRDYYEQNRAEFLN